MSKGSVKKSESPKVNKSVHHVKVYRIHRGNEDKGEGRRGAKIRASGLWLCAPLILSDSL